MKDERLPLEERTLQFSNDILKFCASELKSPLTRPIIDQLIRSATAIGANYAEAINAASKNDFRNKLFIAKKEAAEAKYWLTLMNGVASDKSISQALLTECHYILMTLQKGINTLRAGDRTPVTGNRSATGNRTPLGYR